jgi:hypothetical protein
MLELTLALPLPLCRIICCRGCRGAKPELGLGRCEPLPERLRQFLLPPRLFAEEEEEEEERIESKIVRGKATRCHVTPRIISEWGVNLVWGLGPVEYICIFIYIHITYIYTMSEMRHGWRVRGRQVKVYLLVEGFGLSLEFVGLHLEVETVALVLLFAEGRPQKGAICNESRP